MNWKISSLIKGPTESGSSWYSNIVGTLQTEKEEYVYKVSRLPSYKAYWEFLISNSIKKNIPSVKNFARVVDVQSLMLDVDEEDRTIPSSKNKITMQRERIVMIQKIIPGYTLANHIKFGCSEKLAFGAMIQVLAALECARTIKFTHYDLHGNNILMQAEKTFDHGKKIFYLYDIGEHPMLIPSFGYRAKIIDYEYSYVEEVEGKPFDSKLDLINRFYIPCEYDPSIDILRFIISCCSYIAEKHSSAICKNILNEIIQFVNEPKNENREKNDSKEMNEMKDTNDLKEKNEHKEENENKEKNDLKEQNDNNSKENSDTNRQNEQDFPKLKFRIEDGLMQEFPDPIRGKVLEISKKKSEAFKNLIECRYYYLVGLLLHNVKVPLKRIHTIDSEEEREMQIDFFVQLICLLTEYSLKTDKCCVALYEVLKGNKEIFKHMGETWNAKFIFLLHASIDSLQTMYHDQIKKCRQIRMEQGEQKFTPTNMIRFLQSRVELKRDIKNGDVIYWMNKQKRKKLCIQLSSKQEKAMNSTYDVFQRGEKLRLLLC